MDAKFRTGLVASVGRRRKLHLSPRPRDTPLPGLAAASCACRGPLPEACPRDTRSGSSGDSKFGSPGSTGGAPSMDGWSRRTCRPGSTGQPLRRMLRLCRRPSSSWRAPAPTCGAARRRTRRPSSRPCSPAGGRTHVCGAEGRRGGGFSVSRGRCLRGSRSRWASGNVPDGGHLQECESCERMGRRLFSRRAARRLRSAQRGPPERPPRPAARP